MSRAATRRIPRACGSAWRRASAAPRTAGRSPGWTTPSACTPAPAASGLSSTACSALLASVPASLAALLEETAADDASAATTLPWYADASGGPALPAAADAEELAAARAATAAAMAAAGVTLAEARAAVVFEDRFNRTVVETGNKAACAWRFVAGHLRDVWRRYGGRGGRGGGDGAEALFVALDRQGGRQFYAEQLERLFPEARCAVGVESPELCSYELAGGGRKLRLEVRPRAEAAHLPVAYASMVAKYLRELLMARFQRFWSEQAPDVRPTAGYHSDGERFLRELAPRLRRLEIPAGTLVRMC